MRLTFLSLKNTNVIGSFPSIIIGSKGVHTKNTVCSFTINNRKEPRFDHEKFLEKKNKSWWGHKFKINKYQLKDTEFLKNKDKGWWNNKMEINKSRYRI